MSESPVRLQWDPDHQPSGAREARRAVQLGLGGEWQRRFAQEWIVELEDVSALVAEQRRDLVKGTLDELRVPRRPWSSCATPGSSSA